MEEKKLKLRIRVATREDVPQITAIYNYEVKNSVATFDTQEKTTEERMEWFNHHSERHPILKDQFTHCTSKVAEIEEGESKGEIAGWLSLSQWSDRLAYQDTAEISEYVKHTYRRRGVGSALIEEGLRIAKEKKFHTIIARIAGGNEASIKYHEKYGFRLVGVMKEVGRKFDKWIDVSILQWMNPNN